MNSRRDTDVVLLGIGHTNAHVVRRWQRHAPKGTRLTCVSNTAVAAYSGMLPGVLAGQYPQQRMEIDLVHLTAAAGARLVVADVTGLDLATRELVLSGRPPLRFDVLSIGIGSMPLIGDVRIADEARLLAVKPMQSLLARLDAALQDAAVERRGRPIRVVIVGGGAGGVELTLCLPPHLRALLGEQAPFDVTMVSAAERPVPGSLDRTAYRIERIFKRRGVRLIAGRRVVRVDAGTITLDDRMSVDADVILWATSAAAPPLLARLGLPTDTRGFLLTADTLRTTSGAPVFAVGDTGTVAGASTPKAGVYAVRQGPVLWDNILRTLSGSPLRQYVPQRGFLKLLNTGDGRAIGEWRGLSFEGAWCWWLKDYIDGRFVEQYQSGGMESGTTRER